MQLVLSIKFQTDGDFWFNGDGLFDPNANMYSGAEIHYLTDSDDGEISFILTCEGDEDACCWAARDLMEGLVCRIICSETHYWMVKKIYDFIIEPKENMLWSDDDVHYIDTIGGNYQGTELCLNIIH